MLNKFLFLCLISIHFSIYSQTEFEKEKKKKEEIVTGASKIEKEKVTGADSTGWDFKGSGSINFSRIHLSNWAAGGVNNISYLGLVNVFANYKKGKIAWDNSGLFSYGQIKEQNKPLQKNEDRLDLTSKLGYGLQEKIFIASLVNFRSQFSPTFTPEGKHVSGFMAPAFGLIALGMDFKPIKDWEIFFSPLTGKFTFVLDEKLANEGAFGVKPAVMDSTNGNVLTKGETFRHEVGAYLNVTFKKEILKNVSLSTRLELFNNYSDPNKPNRKNIDVNWETFINLKVNKYIVVSIFTHLLYDNDIAIPIDKDGDGVLESKGIRTQFKDVLGIGLSYKFSQHKNANN